MFVRCPECNYALWNLKARACPECGRAFSLDEWDFANSDALFACCACGEQLVGTKPLSLPDACPACDEAVEPSLVVVQRGATGRNVPRHAREGWRGLRRACTATMVVGALAMFAMILHGAGNSGGRLAPDPLLAFVAAYAMGAGVFGAWPARLGLRVGVLLVLFAVTVAALLGSFAIQNHNQRLHQQTMWQSRCIRGVAQGMMISMQQTGTLPAEPQGLVDAQLVPPVVFYPRNDSGGFSMTPTPLPDGWLTVGEMHIDWTPTAWSVGNSVVVLVYEHSLRDRGLLIAFSDAHVDWVSWNEVPQRVPTWNQDRAAVGLPPIPADALPPP